MIVADPFKKLKDAMLSRAASIATAITDGDISPTEEEILTLERLTRVAQLSAVAPPPKRAPLWPIAIAFFLSVGMVSILAFTHVSTALVRLDITASDIQFSTVGSAELTPRLSVSNLTVVNSSEFSIADPKHPMLVNDGESRAIKLNVAKGQAGNSGLISIAPLAVTKQTPVSLSALKNGNIQMEFSPQNATIEASLRGTVITTTTQLVSAPLTYSIATAAKFVAADGPINLEFPLSQQQSVEAFRGLEIESLTFKRVVVRQEEDTRASPLLVSSIIEGKMEFDGYERREILLHEARASRFTQFVGTIISLSVVNGRLQLRLVGRASNIEIRVGEQWRTLMPSRLEFLKQNHELALLWGAALYLFGLIIGFLKWARWTS